MKLKVSHIYLFLCLFFLANSSTGELFAQESIKFITYGNSSSSQEGDEDFKEIFILKVPESAKNKLFLRIFDIDCGGANDFFGGSQWNTKTTFSFSGGNDSIPLTGLDGQTNTSGELNSGILLRSETFGESGRLDNDWTVFHSFFPSEGFLYEGFYYFRLLVEGKEGTNGNVYDVFLSTSEVQNIPLTGAKILNFVPTIRLLKKDPDAALKFTIPAGTSQLEISDFDSFDASFKLRTALRSEVPLKSSGNGVWATNTVPLQFEEDGRMAALIFGQGGETPNDATFRIKSNTGGYIGIECPVYPASQNTIPAVSYKYDFVADCNSVIFDATATKDAENQQLEYKWHLGDGKIVYGGRVLHKYEQQKEYTVSLIVTDNSGAVYNSSAVSFKVKLNVPPVAVHPNDLRLAPGEEYTFDASSSYDSDGSIVEYIWDFGDAVKKEGKIVKYTYSRAGKFNAKLMVKDNSISPCNTAVAQISVWVNLAPIASAGNDMAASVGQRVTFDGRSSRDDDGSIADYLWDFGDGTSASGALTAHIYENPGVYTATLTVTDDANASNSKTKDNVVVVVNNPPVAVPGANMIAAENEPLFFDGSKSYDPDGLIADYIWDFGDGGSASGVKVAHSFSRPGRYTVKLTVMDNSGTNSNSASATLTVIINSRPVAIAGKDEVITRSEFQFDGTSSSDPDGKIMKYFWDFGDGKTSTEPAPRHYFEKPGLYKIRLRVTDDTQTQNNTSESEFDLIVNAKPVADAGPDLLGAPGQPLTFDGSASYDPDGSIIEHQWEFGDGGKSDQPVAEHSYRNPGTYFVRLKVKDNTSQTNAVDYDEVKVTINSKPVAIAGRDIVAAPNSPVTFIGTASYDPDGSITQYSWSFSNSDEILNDSVVTQTFESAGIYTAVLEVRDNSNAINNISRDTLRLRINSSPTAVSGRNIFTCDTKIVFDGSGSTDPDGDPLKYFWDFGDGTKIESGSRTLHDFKKSGRYPIILTVDDGLGLPNSRTSSSHTVIINEPPVAAAGEDINVCSGETVRFNGSGSKDPDGGFLKYTWDFGDGTTGQGINPTKIYKTGGAYSVRLKVEDDSGLPCNFSYSTLTVNVLESPVAFAGEDLTVCLNSVVKFNGTKSKDNDGVVNNYLWDFGDGQVGGGPNPSHIYSKAGVYTVRLTITGDPIGECDNTDTDELTVTVFEAPIADFTLPAMYPRDTELTLTTEGSNTFTDSLIGVKWDFGDGTESTEFTGKHTYVKEGKYIVTLTLFTNATTECKTATAQKIIVINAPPIADAGDTVRSGIGQEINFNGSRSIDPDGAIISYAWDFGDGNKGNGVTARHKYEKGGEYRVILTVKDNTTLSNNTSVDTTFALINFTPEPSISFKEVVCIGEPVAFSAGVTGDKDGDALSYEWDLGDGFKSTEASLSHIFTYPGVYNITLVVDDGKGYMNSRNRVVKQLHVNNKPIASAGRGGTYCVGEKIILDGTKSFDADGDNLKYEWFNGAKKIGEGALAEVSFDKGGQYKIVLRVSDERGTACSQSFDSTVVRVNSSPVAETAAKTMAAFTGGAHDQVLFDGSLSKDADGDDLNYVWDFGDGTKASGEKVYHYFDRPGVYTVTLEVSDGSGLNCGRSTASITVTVQQR